MNTDEVSSFLGQTSQWFYFIFFIYLLLLLLLLFFFFFLCVGGGGGGGGGLGGGGHLGLIGDPHIETLEWTQWSQSTRKYRKNKLHITKTRLFKYIENFTTKTGKFSDKKNSDIFYFSAQNIDCGTR